MSDARFVHANSTKQRFADEQVLDFEKRATELGIHNSVFPNGKSVCISQSDMGKHALLPCNGGDCPCLQDKLQEFVEYQMPQRYLEKNFDLGVWLTSPEGKEIFKEAIQMRFMECYYTISQHIDNQTENTCSTTSIVAALNALGIDPAYATWYEEYRWHHLESLACCTPVLKSANFTLHQLCCLAVCNDLLTFPVMVGDDWTLDQLREWVKFATSRSDVVMIANYGRTAVNQLGIGHFLPISGYHQERDMVLLLETAKHKYPACWLPLIHLMHAMQDCDHTRNIDHRGFAIAIRPDYQSRDRLFGPSLSLRLDVLPNDADPCLKSFMTRWNKFLNTEIPQTTSCYDILSTTIDNFVSSLPEDSTDPTTHLSLMTLTLVHFRSHHRNGTISIVGRCQKPHQPSSCHNLLFLQQLQTLDVFKKIQACFTSLGDKVREKIIDLVVCDLDGIDQAAAYAKCPKNIRRGLMTTLASVLKTEALSKENTINNKGKITENGYHDYHKCPGYIEILPAHIMTFLLLSWPFKEVNVKTTLSFSKFILNDAVFDTSVHSSDYAILKYVSHKLRTLKTDKKIDKGEDSNAFECTPDIPITAQELANKMKSSINVFSGPAKGRPRASSYMTVRSALQETMQHQFTQMSSLPFVKDHVKALKRKLNVILQYYRL